MWRVRIYWECECECRWGLMDEMYDAVGIFRTAERFPRDTAKRKKGGLRTGERM